MIKPTSYSFIKSHNLVVRVCDMLLFLGVFEEVQNLEYLFQKIEIKLHEVDYVETLAKYFEKQLKMNYKNIELRCSLKDLIYDLNILKLYLNEEETCEE